MSRPRVADGGTAAIYGGVAANILNEGHIDSRQRVALQLLGLAGIDVAQVRDQFTAIVDAVRSLRIP
jgi:hypothetical protein